MELSQAKIKDCFTITIGGEYIASTSPLLAFGEYEIVTSVAHILDENIFNTYEEAEERVKSLFAHHKLLKNTTNPANKIEIKNIRILDVPMTRRTPKMIKTCPICGDMPMLDKKSLAQGNGHGYPHNFEYIYILNCGCGHMNGGYAVDIWKSSDEAKDDAVIQWNKEATEVEQLLAANWSRTHDER